MIQSYEGVRLPPLPVKKSDLQAYFVHLTFTIERELVEIPNNIHDLKHECRDIQKHLIMCNMKVPKYDGRMKDYI